MSHRNTVLLKGVEVTLSPQEYETLPSAMGDGKGGKPGRQRLCRPSPDSKLDGKNISGEEVIRRLLLEGGRQRIFAMGGANGK